MIIRNNRQKQKANVLLNTQKKTIEETLKELKSTQAQLIQSEKMASLGELTSGIAHELQNPLNFVNNFSEVNAEMMEEMINEIKNGNTTYALDIAAMIEKNLNKIKHHGKRAGDIVKSMLQHSRSTRGKMEPTDINALVDENLRLSLDSFRVNNNEFRIMTVTNLDQQAGYLNVVPGDLGRVLLNIFQNAFWALAKKKKEAGESFEPRLDVSTKRENGNLEIHIRDNGGGIPEKITSRIFQPFFTTKPTGQGTGLGLSLSYDIIKTYNGELLLESREGDFAEFIIRLPA
jgi:signal transduction histidine kinase